jgi:hypothetical protein
MQVAAFMKNLVLNLPTFGFVVATRAMLGAGIGLLVSDRLPAERRRVIGLTLAVIGAAATIPAVLALRQARRNAKALEEGERTAMSVA